MDSKKQEEKEDLYRKQVERKKLLKEMVVDPLRHDWYKMREVQLNQDDIILKSILSLSAGIFGVSFAFINTIVPFAGAGHKHILIASWALFALAIVLVLICRLVSSFVHGKRCDDIKGYVELAYKGKPVTEVKRWYYEWLTAFFELLAFACFLCGAALLVGFIWLNI